MATTQFSTVVRGGGGVVQRGPSKDRGAWLIVAKRGRDLHHDPKVEAGAHLDGDPVDRAGGRIRRGPTQADAAPLAGLPRERAEQRAPEHFCLRPPRLLGVGVWGLWLLAFGNRRLQGVMAEGSRWIATALHTAAATQRQERAHPPSTRRRDKALVLLTILHRDPPCWPQEPTTAVAPHSPSLPPLPLVHDRGAGGPQSPPCHTHPTPPSHTSSAGATRRRTRRGG